MRIEKVLISPDFAQNLLKRNTQNRTIKPNVVLQFAKDMRDGKWKEDTAEMIKVAKNGTILDGQHRLMAIVKSGATVPIHIAYDLENHIFDVLDTGIKRTGGDVLSLLNVKNAALLSSIISSYQAIKYGKAISLSNDRRITNADIKDIYLRRPEFWQNVAAFAKRCNRIYPICSVGELAAFYAAFSEMNVGKAEVFFNELFDFAPNTNRTIIALRKKLTQDKISTKKLPIMVRRVIFVKAWNYFVSGKSVNVLNYYAGEKMPEILW